MLLSHQKKFLFVHIAKTGGTSVRAALQNQRWRDPYYAPIWLASKLSGLVNHEVGIKLPRHAKAIAAKEMLPHEFYQTLFKFAFVRNPWDLQVSSYHHIRRERPHLLKADESFEAFLRRKLDPSRKWQYHIDTSITPQTDYLVDLNGNLIVDFIGHYETLQQDFDHCCQRIGVP
ncbi:MAG: sulfotransferase family 2 domain-containing protein, partial [Luminiphilus sp.]|nr:sulfotransferase family 2 domain-containing protein [Luminiphilus sp.]